MRDVEIADPFGLASTPSAYVARNASERAMTALDDALLDGRVPGLVGPPGLGKTLLLQRVAARIDDRTAPVYIPYSTLTLRELCKLVLGLVEEPPTDDPEEALRQILQELYEQQATLLLLIDDAGMMPTETASQLATWVDDAKGALKVVLAAVDSQAAHDVFEAFGERLARIRLDEDMSLDETREYIERRLAIVGAPQGMRDAFDEAAIRRVFRESRGNPRAVNVAAQAVVRASLPRDAPLLREVYDPSLYDIRVEEPDAERPIALRVESDAEPGEGAVIELPSPEADAGDDTEPPEASEEQAALEAGEEEGAYRVVRGRRVKNAEGDLGAYEGRATLERIPPGTAEIAARIGEAEPALAGPLQDLPFDDGKPRSRASRLLALGDAITQRPLALAGSLAVAIVLGLGFGLLVGPTTVPASAPSERVTGTAPAQTVPVTYRIGINATPWALIEVDGEERGETPIADLELSAGTHTIRAYYPDGEVRERVIEVDASTRSVVFE